MSRPKTGGRKKGTPNKATAPLREWVSEFVDSNRDQIVADFKQLEPPDRLRFIEKLIGYVLPKPSTVAVDLNTQIEQTAAARDPLAKPFNFPMVFGMDWDKMTDEEKAKELAYFYKHYDEKRTDNPDCHASKGIGIWLSKYDK